MLLPLGDVPTRRLSPAATCVKITPMRGKPWMCESKAAGADPPAAAGHPQHRGRGDLQRAELLVQPPAQPVVAHAHRGPPAWRRGAASSVPVSASAPLARSLASARAAWLRTVLAEQPSRAAAWASLRSSQ